MKEHIIKDFKIFHLRNKKTFSKPSKDKYRFEILIFLMCFGLWLHYQLTNTVCIIRGSIGLPCPTCGMTRAYEALLRGDFALAFEMHPLFWIVPIGAIYLLILHYYRPKWNSSYILGALIFVFIGLYIYRMVVYFPVKEPMQWNVQSYLWRGIGLIRRLIH